MTDRGFRAILDEAVRRIGGQQRPGQMAMAEAVDATLRGDAHLLVQAGTGTGKSWGYLAPALSYLAEDPRRHLIIATATLALQAQLADKDVPDAVEAAESVTGKRVAWAVLKGRSNYACLYRVRDGLGQAQETLLGGAELADNLRAQSASQASVVGAEVVALREWVEQEVDTGELADRDDAPTHSAQAWAQVSISARECLGAQRCPFGAECLVEEARARAREAQLVVANHALVAIDAMQGGTALPEHDAVIIDEAHELVARVTTAASHELSPQAIGRVARRCLPWLTDDTGLEFLESADELRYALDESPVDRIDDPDAMVVLALRTVRDAARKVVSGLSGGSEDDNERRQASAAAKEILDIAEQMAKLDADDVIWVGERERAGRQVYQAPLSVIGLMRDHIFGQGPAVLTSATLTIGGDFLAMAASMGLSRTDRVPDGGAGEPQARENADAGIAWRGLDVGSPFDYRRQGILYVAKELPTPTRDGISQQALDEIAELVWAAGGRTLGLFASQRSAEAAAVHCRAQIPGRTILCQGDAHLPELTRRFVAEPSTSLFGTLSLWQGVDVPGETCVLVIIDKIPFPRPDEPLQQARQRAIADAGGNGFMQVAATQAALLLAQGSGRLIRRDTDRGVVAILDPRLVSARYGPFLRASLPDFWMTTDREVAIGALRRLSEPLS